MERLPEQNFTTRGRTRSSGSRADVVLLALLFLSCGLLAGSRLEIEPVRWLRGTLTRIVAPAIEPIAASVAWTRHAIDKVGAMTLTAQEIEALKRENERLRSQEWRGQDAERRITQLSALARSTGEIGLDWVSAPVIGLSSGPVAHSALVKAGEMNGVRTGFAAVGSEGLVGHVVETGPRVSRVLLLTDPDSRIPVRVGASAQRAILKGDGTAAPVLRLSAQGPGSVTAGRDSVLQPTGDVRTGDEVTTSGDDGLLPRGVRIGVVLVTDDGPRVVLAAKFRMLEYVSLLVYQPHGIDGTGNGPSIAGRDVTTGKLEPTSAQRRDATAFPPPVPQSRRSAAP